MKSTDSLNASATIDTRLLRYGCAAGLVFSGTAAGQVFHFDPPGGLPIVIDDTAMAPVDIDLDNDGDVDFQIGFYNDYGGGFEIVATNFNTVDTGSFVPNVEYLPVTRYDLSEWIDDESTRMRLGTMFTGIERALDARGGVPEAPPFNPFRNSRGFIGLSLQDGEMDPSFSSALEISVSADGTQLTIHSGRALIEADDRWDLFLLPEDVFADNFEGATVRHAPKQALQKLAAGVED